MQYMHISGVAAEEEKVLEDAAKKVREQELAAGLPPRFGWSGPVLQAQVVDSTRTLTRQSGFRNLQCGRPSAPSPRPPAQTHLAGFVGNSALASAALSTVLFLDSDF